jgi:hypothetical protein
MRRSIAVATPHSKQEAVGYDQQGSEYPLRVL